MSEIIYNQIYYLGIQTIRYGKRFFRWLLSLLLKPVKAIGTLIFTIIIVVDKFALKTFHEIMDEFRELVADAKKVSFKLSAENAGGKIGVFKRLSHYIRVAYRKYKKAFIYVFNIALPVLSLLFLFNVIGAWSDLTFALEINYNDQVIGYVRSEAEYKEARELAFDRLDLSASSSAPSNTIEETELIGEADFKIKPVKLSQLNDAAEVCDKLIANSESKITNACGIYVDNTFICAVKNETDALSVLDNILAEHETDEANAVVSFVEDIEYVQGLYPDNEGTVKDASYLSEKLNSKKSEAVYYTVQAGDTVSGIADKFDMKSSEIFNLNPKLKESIQIGQKILISSEVNFIQVQVTKTETRKVEIGYDTIKVNTSSLYKGDKKVVTKGVKGLEEVTELVTYIDGVRVSSKEVSRTTIREAVNEKIQVGTKTHSYSSGGGGGSYTGGRLGWPTIGAYSISSRYGYRNFGDGWHGGIDIVRPGGSSGCTVVAAESGTVTFAGWYGSGGYTVIINHGGGLTTMYCHMQPGLKVRSGQRVSRGQAIGKIGATGYVTGAHLHFEVKVNGNNVNPALYLGV
mgnify:FL=1